ncbi:hypothetical protein GPALN_014687 [Globodera pallida]|nr:hypothetical protein GPALN_014687 [Globodera pallida]
MRSRLLSIAPRQFWPFVRPFSIKVDDVTESVEVLRARLLYQSRKRGIRENDILIGGFADQHLAQMGKQELEQYDRIINGQHNEWDLFHYLSGAKEVPSDLSNNSIFRHMKLSMAKQTTEPKH